MPNQPIDWKIDPPLATREIPQQTTSVGGLLLAGVAPQQLPPGTLMLTGIQEAQLQPGSPFYFSWGCSSIYLWDYGIRGAPAASERRAKQVAVWRVHSGLCYRVVTWSAQTFKEKPPLPKARTNQPNEVLVAKAIITPSPAPLPMGDALWTFLGQYTYLLQQWPDDDEVLPMQASPALSLAPASQYVLSPGAFQDLINTAAPNGFNGNVVNF